MVVSAAGDVVLAMLSMTRLLLMLRLPLMLLQVLPLMLRLPLMLLMLLLLLLMLGLRLMMPHPMMRLQLSLGGTHSARVGLHSACTIL